jgi:hypothetical protein
VETEAKDSIRPTHHQHGCGGGPSPAGQHLAWSGGGSSFGWPGESETPSDGSPRRCSRRPHCPSHRRRGNSPSNARARLSRKESSSGRWLVAHCRRAAVSLEASDPFRDHPLRPTTGEESRSRCCGRPCARVISRSRSRSRLHVPGRRLAAGHLPRSRLTNHLAVCRTPCGLACYPAIPRGVSDR